MEKEKTFNVEELKNDLIRLKSKRDELSLLNNQVKNLTAEVREKEKKLCLLMKDNNLDKLPIEKVGNFKAYKKLEVYPPGQLENKVLFMNALKDILGAEGFLSKVNVPYVSLQSLIHKMQDEIKDWWKKNKVEGMIVPNEVEQKKAEQKIMESTKTEDPVLKQKLLKEAEELKEMYPYLLPGIISMTTKYKMSITKNQ